MLPNGLQRWRIRFDITHSIQDVTIAIRLDPFNQSELDYYLLPKLDLPSRELQVTDRNIADFECFRFDDLNFFYGMSVRERVIRKI
jgi:hypothetical protein